MSTPVLILTHAPWEGPGLIARALDAAKVPYIQRSIVDGTGPELPPLSSLAGLVLMGGPMDADDVAAFPGLAREADLVRDAVGRSLPVLGICLGHQIIALALGAALAAGATCEIGLGPVESLDPLLDGLGRTPVVHWHTDNAGLPAGAQLLARTPGCPNQAFRAGSALGIQFHLELDAELLRSWLDDGGMAAELDGTTAAELLDGFRASAPERTRAALAVFAGFARAVTEQFVPSEPDRPIGL
ncbi:MAG TPA: type 1 glutamine amidotransferase [Micrococcaceae bacterium]